MATSKNRTYSEQSSWKTSLAGTLGNISIMIFQPFENVKLRLQINDGMKNNHIPQYKGIGHIVKTMYKTEGLISFYRGVYINLMGNSVANAIFFYIYGYEKKLWNYKRETAPMWLTAYISMKAAVISCAFTNPIWVIKTRISLNVASAENQLSGNQLTKSIVNKMYHEGLRSFYRGFPAALFLSLFGVVQMSSYEKLSYLAGSTEDK